MWMSLGSNRQARQIQIRRAVKNKVEHVLCNFDTFKLNVLIGRQHIHHRDKSKVKRLMLLNTHTFTLEGLNVGHM